MESADELARRLVSANLDKILRLEPHGEEIESCCFCEALYSLLRLHYYMLSGFAPCCLGIKCCLF